MAWDKPRVILREWKGMGCRTTLAVAFVVSFLIPAANLDAQQSGYELRYIGDADKADSFDVSSVPEEFRQPLPEVELVSVTAHDAPKPQSTLESRTLESIDTGAFIDKLDVDRLLLSEIRKPVPDDRGEAETYLARLKYLAGQADPVRLVPLANRLLDQAPIYFDWLDREFADQDEQLMEYYVGGARGFSFALDNFKTAVMFAIINSLDVASRVIYELDTTR